MEIFPILSWFKLTSNLFGQPNGLFLYPVSAKKQKFIPVKLNITNLEPDVWMHIIKELFHLRHMKCGEQLVALRSTSRTKKEGVAGVSGDREKGLEAAANACL